MRLIVAIALIVHTAPVQAVSAFVSRVVDGDTVKVEVHGDLESVRLLCIDSPESNQDYGREAEEYLREMIEGKWVELDIEDRDRYGRILAFIQYNSRDVNENLVSRGLAWNYEYYCEDKYAGAQEKARMQGIGLWSLDNPIPPWVWRRNKL